jgi:hypothetical protein
MRLQQQTPIQNLLVQNQKRNTQIHPAHAYNTFPKTKPEKKKHRTEQNRSAEKKEKSKLAEYKLQPTEEQQEQQGEKSQAASGF